MSQYQLWDLRAGFELGDDWWSNAEGRSQYSGEQQVLRVANIGIH